MRHWRCRLVAGRLVDYAGGTLPARHHRRLERHLAGCAACRAALAALRDVPAALHTDAVPDPGEAFWTAQRAAVRRALATLPEPQRQPWLALPWRPGWPAALAAATAAVVLAVWTLMPGGPVGSGAPMQLASLDSDTLVGLGDILAPDPGPDDLVADAADEALLAALAAADAQALLDLPVDDPLLGPSAPADADLDDTALDRLATLLGETG